MDLWSHMENRWCSRIMMARYYHVRFLFDPRIPWSTFAFVFEIVALRWHVSSCDQNNHFVFLRRLRSYTDSVIRPTDGGFIFKFQFLSRLIEGAIGLHKVRNVISILPVEKSNKQNKKSEFSKLCTRREECLIRQVETNCGYSTSYYSIYTQNQLRRHRVQTTYVLFSMSSR